MDFSDCCLFDTHAHLDDPRLAEQLEFVLLRAAAAQVRQMMTIATDLASSQRAAELAGRFPGQIYAAIGFQPNNCAALTNGEWDQMVALASSPGVVATGETGLDRYWNDCPFDVQQHWFDRHIQWSADSGLPLVIHMRDCEQDIVDSLEQHKTLWPLAGIMHSFTGTLETAQRCMEAGLHISFAGMVTYKNAADLRDVARQIPLDRLLVETDSPYLSPEPVRKHRPNEPAMVIHTAQCIANERGISLNELAKASTSNARRLLGI